MKIIKGFSCMNYFEKWQLKHEFLAAKRAARLRRYKANRQDHSTLTLAHERILSGKFEEKIKKQIKEIEIFYNNKQFIEANNLCIATHQLMSSTNTSQELADYILIISLFSCARFYFKKNLFPKCYETLATANQHINRISNEPFKKHLLEILKSFNWNSLEEADDFCNFMLPGPALKNDKN